MDATTSYVGCGGGGMGAKDGGGVEVFSLLKKKFFVLVFKVEVEVQREREPSTDRCLLSPSQLRALSLLHSEQSHHDRAHHGALHARGSARDECEAPMVVSEVFSCIDRKRKKKVEKNGKFWIFFAVFFLF